MFLLASNDFRFYCQQFAFHYGDFVQFHLLLPSIAFCFNCSHWLCIADLAPGIHGGEGRQGVALGVMDGLLDTVADDAYVLAGGGVAYTAALQGLAGFFKNRELFLPSLSRYARRAEGLFAP